MPERIFLRDGRAPIPKNVATSAIMSRIRARNTGPELQLRKALSKASVKGYRLYYKKAHGTPDIAFVGRKVAVFVHGCFWHSCPHCQLKRPKANTKFWNQKLDRNQERDQRKVNELSAYGWRVITIWACRLKHNEAQQVARILRALISN